MRPKNQLIVSEQMTQRSNSLGLDYKSVLGKVSLPMLAMHRR